VSVVGAVDMFLFQWVWEKREEEEEEGF